MSANESLALRDTVLNGLFHVVFYESFCWLVCLQAYLEMTFLCLSNTWALVLSGVSCGTCRFQFVMPMTGLECRWLLVWIDKITDFRIAEYIASYRLRYWYCPEL